MYVYPNLLSADGDGVSGVGANVLVGINVLIGVLNGVGRGDGDGVLAGVRSGVTFGVMKGVRFGEAERVLFGVLCGYKIVGSGEPSFVGQGVPLTVLCLKDGYLWVVAYIVWRDWL